MITFIFIDTDGKQWKCDFTSGDEAIANKECHPNTKIIQDVLGNVVWNAEENHGPNKPCNPDPVVSKG